LKASTFDAEAKLTPVRFRSGRDIQ